MPAGEHNQRSARNAPKPNEREPAGATSREGADEVDFGTYVSSTVRSSAELFGTPARSAPSRRRQQREPVKPPSSDIDREPVRQPVTTAPASPEVNDRRKSSRYWRESVAAPEETPEESDGGASGGDGGAYSWLSRGDGGGPESRMIVLGLLAALVLLVAIIWFFASRGGDDNGGDETPTGTSEAVIDTDATTTPDEPVLDDVTPTEESETPTPEPTVPTTRGGDNQRNRDDDDGTPGAENEVDIDSLELGPVAQECPERCLVRVQAARGIDDILETARTRPSFETGEWVWAVATTPGIAYLEQQGETVLVADTPETLDLYMAVVPAEEASSDRASQLGTVIDSIDEYRLIRADRVPANVRPLTDWGYTVSKVAPAPPEEVLTPDETIPLANVEIGALMEEVSESRIEEDILTLQAMGSGDGSGIGTRYYTTTGNSMAAEFLFTRLESYGLDVRYQDFLSWEGYLMVNVIGELPGNDASAIYGVMAHFDTIADDINVSPGADDNATGVSGALEIARILAGYDLNHPVHVIFVNVEEVGIVGSEQFAKQAREAGIPYEGVFNLDSIGAQRQYGYMVTNGNASTVWMSDLMKEMNETYGLGQVINARQSEAIVADDNRLRDNGIDSLMIARELYGQSPTHHTSGDLIDTLWIKGVQSCTQVTLLSIASLVQ